MQNCVLPLPVLPGCLCPDELNRKVNAQELTLKDLGHIEACPTCSEVFRLDFELVRLTLSVN